jgi:hypothetical protein
MTTDLAPNRPARAHLRAVLACTTAGALVGLLVGGVGGRLAMLVLRLTSSDALRGMLTDDEFEIGAITAATFFLLGLAAAVGGVAGAIYGAARPFLPVRRVAVAAAVGGLVGGAAIIRPGGVDFGLLDPLVLAVAMFVAIPAAGGAGIAALGERWVASGWWGRDRLRTALTFVPAIPMVVLAPMALPVAVLTALGVLARRRGLDRDVRVRVAAAAVVTVVCALAAVALVGDVAEII